MFDHFKKWFARTVETLPPAPQELSKDEERLALIAVQGGHAQLELRKRQYEAFWKALPDGEPGMKMLHVINAGVYFEVGNGVTKKSEHFGIKLGDISVRDGVSLPPIRIDRFGKETTIAAAMLDHCRTAFDLIMYDMTQCQNVVSERLKDLIETAD